MQRPEFGRHITYKLFPFILRLISLLLLWFLPLRVFLHQLQTYIQTFFIRTIYIFVRPPVKYVGDFYLTGILSSSSFFAV